MIKKIWILLSAVFLIACSDNSSAENSTDKEKDTTTATASADTTKKSIPSEAKKQIGGSEIKINYTAAAG